MCQASKISDDWVVKGCHIHIGAVELVVFPDHNGAVGFKSFFARTAKNWRAVDQALAKAAAECLKDPQTRDRWIRSLKQAIRHMLSFQGEPSTLANGRMLEFKFLIIALERYSE